MNTPEAEENEKVVQYLLEHEKEDASQGLELSSSRATRMTVCEMARKYPVLLTIYPECKRATS